MSASVADYTAALQALLPPGPAWPRDPDAVLTQLLAAKAAGLAAVDAQGDALLLEADPRTADQLLPSWLSAFGIPYPGAPSPPDNATAQAAVVQQMTLQPSPSRTWFKALATFFGFQSEILTYRPFRAGMSSAGDPVATDPCRFAWTLVLYTTPALGPASYNALVLQAMVLRYQPAEGFLTISFVDPDASLFEYDFLTGP